MKLSFLMVATLPLLAVADLCDFVDPFVGTAGTGHTFPGACVPFGLIQAGPDTGNGDWDHCSGYVYGDKHLYGFTQTHLNGTGCSDLGDIRLLPFTTAAVPDTLPLDKATEKAAPGYYTVTAGGVKTEITATKHVASYQFTFPKGAKKRLLVDTAWGLRSFGDGKDRVKSAEVKMTDSKSIMGVLKVQQWNPRTVGFVVQPAWPCQLAVESITELPHLPGEKAPRFVIDFTDGEAPIFVDVALSSTSAEAAQENLTMEHSWISQAPNPTFFNCLVAQAKADWEQLLARSTIEGTVDQKRNWYTSLYHLFVQPNDIADVGQSPFYSTFSCWDTFRAAGPLYTILMPERASAFVDSMLRQGQLTGFLPIWTLWGAENNCMIGTHSIPMIVDAYLKGTWTGDAEAAYAQVKSTLLEKHANRWKENWDEYDRYGYYPFDLINGESVSRTLECCYDDWCAAQFAQKLGKAEDAARFLKRANYWKNVFDTETGFVRGKDSKGKWRTPFNPFQLGHGAGGNDFTEGNSFQYSWHVMQDPAGLEQVMGGRAKLIAKLDKLFAMTSEGEGMGHVVDVTGLIGQYVHGNEPSHHVIYFYSLVGEQRKTAARVREVFDRFYLPKPDGLCGNDDCGQMSAWYLFSAMGFYPFNPCGGDYVVGAPQVDKVTLKLSGGKTFTVVAKNLSPANKYVKSMTLNGKPFAGPILKHAEVMAGGELVFEMTKFIGRNYASFTVSNMEM